MKRLFNIKLHYSNKKRLCQSGAEANQNGSVGKIKTAISSLCGFMGCSTAAWSRREVSPYLKLASVGWLPAAKQSRLYRVCKFFTKPLSLHQLNEYLLSIGFVDSYGTMIYTTMPIGHIVYITIDKISVVREPLFFLNGGFINKIDDSRSYTLYSNVVIENVAQLKFCIENWDYWRLR